MDSTMLSMVSDVFVCGPMSTMMDSRGLNWCLLRLGLAMIDGFLMMDDGLLVRIGINMVLRLTMVGRLSMVDWLSLMDRRSMVNRLFFLVKDGLLYLLLLLFVLSRLRLSFMNWLLFMSLFFLHMVRCCDILKKWNMGTVRDSRRLDGLRGPFFDDFGGDCCFVMCRHNRLSNELLVEFFGNFDVFLV